MADTLPKELVASLKQWFGARRTKFLVLFFIGASATVFLVSHSTTNSQLLAAGFWICVACWYLHISYKTARPEQAKKTLLAVALLSTSWVFGFVWNLTSDIRHIRRSASVAEASSDRGMFVEGAASYMDAVAVAHAAGYRIQEAKYLCKAGKSLFLASQIPQAEKAYNDCRQIATVEKDEKELAESEVGLGDVASTQGKPDLARQLFQDGYLGFQKVHEVEGQADAQLGLGKLDTEDGKIDLARQELETAQRLYNKSDEVKGKADALLRLGYLERSIGHLDEARHDFNEVENLCHKSEYRLGEAYAVLFLGELDFMTNNPEGGRESFKKARGLYQEMHSSVGEGTVLRLLGDMDGTLGNPDVAIVHYKEALSLLESQNDLLGMGAAEAGLGRANGVLGHHEVAHDYFTKAKETFQKAEERRGEANVDYLDAQALLKMGKKDEAIASLERCKALCTDPRLSQLFKMATELEDAIQKNGPEAPK